MAVPLPLLPGRTRFHGSERNCSWSLGRLPFTVSASGTAPVQVLGMVGLGLECICGHDHVL